MGANELVASNVRRIRLERGLSLGELGRRAGLSKQTLSRLEQGDGNPTIETLEALGAALDVAVRSLVTHWGSPVFVRRAAEGDWTVGASGQQCLLDEVYGSGYVRTLLLRLARGDDSGTIAPFAAGTLHHAYVVSGKVRLGPVTDLVELSAGDFIRFPGDVAHRQEALSDRAFLHIVTTLPQARQFGGASASVPAAQPSGS